MKPRIRSSVGIVINEGTVEFFKGNTRRSILLKLNETVGKIICSFDGKKTLEQIYEEYHINAEGQDKLDNLISFLCSKKIVYDEEKRCNNEIRKKYSRVFSMLEDFACDEEKIWKAWTSISNSTVCIVGVGAVGSWIAANLVQSGVKKLILIDNDIVELHNIHRQWGYYESDVGKNKLDCLEHRLKEFDSEIHVTKINQFIDKDTFDFLQLSFDLIIDCADKPTVDQTALWIGEYCMKKNIPHIIAGGYNLHISLIGQTVIPFKTACVKCFEKQLSEQNAIETANMKKLAIQGRKIGSVGPMCALSASFASLEALKVLSNLIEPSNVNRRGEFNLYKMDINYHYYDKIAECEWCGENGKYRK